MSMKETLQLLAVKLTPGDGTGGTVDVPQLSGDMLLQNGLNLTYFIAGIIAIIVIVVGGIMYTTSGGDSSSVTKAKNLILYSVVGLVLILAAFGITNFVIGRF